jgi:hypothetical protein
MLSANHCFQLPGESRKALGGLCLTPCLLEPIPGSRVREPLVCRTTDHGSSVPLTAPPGKASRDPTPRCFAVRSNTPSSRSSQACTGSSSGLAGVAWVGAGVAPGNSGADSALPEPPAAHSAFFRVNPSSPSPGAWEGCGCVSRAPRRASAGSRDPRSAGCHGASVEETDHRLHQPGLSPGAPEPLCGALQAAPAVETAPQAGVWPPSCQPPQGCKSGKPSTSRRMRAEACRPAVLWVDRSRSRSPLSRP